MKFYFAGSIRGGRDDKEIYLIIIELLKKYGVVLTEHIGDQSLWIVWEEDMSDKKIYIRDVNMLLESDMVVAEVTNPSLWVWYELWFAESKKKKIICLFRDTGERRLSAMISWNHNVEVIKYHTVKDLEDKIVWLFK